MKKLNKIVAVFLVTVSSQLYAGNCPPLSGELIIGTSKGSDFNNITDAMNAIKCGGVSGPVTFLLESGTYKERVLVSSVSGVSAYDPILFQSVSGNPADVTISYNNNDATVVLGSSFVSFENITISHKEGDYGNCLRVEGKASNLRFKGVVFDGVENAPAGVENAAVYFTSTAAKTEIAFEDCEVNYGSMGICKKGVSSETPDTKTIISGTLFFAQTEAGLALYNEDAPVITNNVVSAAGTSKGFKAIYLNNVSKNMVITKNILNTSNSATGLLMHDCMAEATDPGQINNNTMAINGNKECLGIRLSGNTDNQVFNFNRIKLAMNADNASTQGYYSNTANGRNINMMNNLFVDINTGTYTVLGNSYKDFFNQLPGQSNPKLSASANSLSFEKVSSIK